MPNREQIQKEIDALRLQLSIVDTAATTAPDEEKARWNNKRAALQERLESLKNALEEAEAAPVVIDDATADAMLNQILSAQEDSPVIVSEAAPAEEKMAVDEAEAMLNRFLTEDAPATESAPATEPPLFDDATADDLLNQILSAEEPAAESKPPEHDEAAVEAMINEILYADVPSDHAFEPKVRPSEEPPVQEAVPQADEQPIILAAPAAPQTEQPFVPPVQAQPIPQTLVQQTVVQQPIFSKPAEPMQTQSVPFGVMPSDTVMRSVPGWGTGATEAPRNDWQQSVPSVMPILTPFSEDFAERLNAIRAANTDDAETLLQLEKLKLEVEDVSRRAQTAFFDAERMRREAEQIKLAAETERAMYAAEMELQRGLRNQEDSLRQNAEKAEKDRLAEKIARRKAEITAIRNGLQDVKDSDSAFLLREKLFSVQLVLDEEERNSPEITYLLTKSMDDISHAVEVAELKRRIAALVAARKPPVKKKSAAKKKAPAKKAAKKKRPVAMAARRGPMPMRPPVRRRIMPRPSSPYAPRYYR